MSDDWSTFKRIGDDISYDDLVEFSAEDEVASSVIRDASSEGTSTQAGLQTRSLQSAMDNYVFNKKERRRWNSQNRKRSNQQRRTKRR